MFIDVYMPTCSHHMFGIGESMRNTDINENALEMQNTSLYNSCQKLRLFLETPGAQIYIE